jgi:nitrite reductase/ring-hydroxylating ferredoxin subunit
VSEWRDVAPEESFAPGSVRPARVAGVRLAVGRAADGFFAVDGLCPHAGALLGDGLVDGRLLVCPLHAYGFDVRTGLCAEDPSLALRPREVRVANGVLQVRLHPGKDARA